MALAPFTAFAASFGDVGEGHWAYDAVERMAAAGVINGFPDGSFKPSDTVTYGEFIKMAYLAAGGADPGSAKAGNWAGTYYEAAVDAGLFSKYDIAGAALSYSVPREYMALVLSGVLGDRVIEDYSSIRGNISDVGADTPHEDDIVKVYAAGLITGYPDGTFKPGGTLNRAEAATVIHRLLNVEGRVLPEISDGEETLPDAMPPDDPNERTQLERFNEAASLSYTETGIVTFLETSTSTKPISEIVKDIDYKLIENQGYNVEAFKERLDKVLYYEIFEEYPYKMELVREGRQTGIDMGFDLRGVSMYLIKDHTMIKLNDNVSAVFPGRLAPPQISTDFDYIAASSERANEKVLMLFPNNL
jgi:hypothetical protein